MSLIHVAIPVLKGRIVFVVDRGRPWSVIEHILLDALSRRAWSATELAQAAAIPRRVVVEALVRLMRAGWVGLVSGHSSTSFKATSRGIAVASNVELPRVAELRRRPTNYIMDLVSRETFRNKDLLLVSEEDVNGLAATATVVKVQPASWQAEIDVNDILEVLLDPDETFVSGEPGGVFRKWVTVAVRDGVIVNGLPEKRDLQALRSEILAAASRGQAGMRGDAASVFTVDQSPSITRPKQTIYRQVRFDASDLVLDGPAHREVFVNTLRNARTRVFVHSTFISTEHVLALLPEIEAAVKRGVKVEVFWGQNENIDETNSTQAAIASLRDHPAVAVLNDGLVFRPYSTGSHAKLLIADTQISGEYVAVVGSCNWLVSSFNSYEISVILRDARLVGDVVAFFAQLSCAHDGIWSELATDISRISVELMRQPASKKPNASVAIVIGARHNDFVARARDEAERFVFVASHRLGRSARPGIVTPLVSAAESRGIASEIYYCRLTRPVTNAGGEQLTSEAKDAGVKLECIEAPRLHAKALAWDSDCFLATSLNWLSADQVSVSSLKELGVFVNFPGVVDAMLGNLRAAMQQN